jgi:hypothetical protein
MEFIRHHLAFVFPLLAALCAVAVSTRAWALEPASDGWYHTGDGVRVKKVVFVNVKVYAISHAMKQLPATKSKQAVIDMDTDKKIAFRMLRDVDAEKLQNAMKEGFEMNGYSDGGKIGQFVGAFSNEIKEGQWVTIKYDSAAKTTTIMVQGSGSATVGGVDFMRAVWSLWFGNIDQPALGDSMISRM